MKFIEYFRSGIGIDMTKRYKQYIVVLFVFILIIIWSLFFRSKPEQIQYIAVQKQDLKTVVSTSGILTGKTALNLRFRGAGKLAFMNVKAGDKVFAGQTLASLNTTDLSISLQQAKNTLRDKQTSVDKVIDDINLFQYGQGGFSNINTPNETMAQKQLRTSAEVARDNALDSVKLAQRAFEDDLVLSPISGIITQADFLPGQIVSAADTIARVVDFSEVIFEADVDESDIGNIEIGQKAEVTLNAYGDKQFTAEVLEIIPRTKTISSGATVVAVRIKLDDQSILKIDGLNGQVNIIISSKLNVLVIPQEAVIDNMVFVKIGEGYESVKVTTGEETDSNIEIISGLSEGDEVVINPAAIPKPNNSLMGRILRFLGR